MNDLARPDEVLRCLLRIDRRLDSIERDVSLIRLAVQGHASRISEIEAERLAATLESSWDDEEITVLER